MNRYCWLIFYLHLSITCLAGVTGKIAGRITDAETGNPLAGVNIMIKETHLGSASDNNGNYFILHIPPGQYRLIIQMIGYEKQEIQNIRVSSDYTTTIHAKMRQTVLQGETVVIHAEKPLIRNDLTSSAIAIPESRISELPAEEMETFIKLQAGVTVDTENKIHIRGGRSTEIAYLINGIPVTDGYDKSQAIEIENNTIQELQIISGAFNAEYGQAQSGVINIITKKGSNRFSGQLSLYSGDFISKNKNLFYNIDHIDPLSEKNISAVLSGPVPLTDATFFLSGRLTDQDGWLYGRREYTLPEISSKVIGYTTGNSTSQTGDKSYCSMNNNLNKIFHGNLAISHLKSLPVTYSFFYNQSDGHEYDHRYSKLPEGDLNFNQKSTSHHLQTEYIFSSKSFLSLSLSQMTKQSRRYLFEDILDQRYLFPAISTEQIYQRYLLEGLEYVIQKSNNEHYNIQNQTQIAKLDFISQIHPIHLIKTGLEYKSCQLDYQYFEVINKPGNKIEQIFIPHVDEVSTPRHDHYVSAPMEAAAYLQDKIEFYELVINAGLRFDYFDSRGQVLSKLDQKEGNRLTAPRKKATPKQSLSPRFGFAFPILENGVIHFSYGHFTQIPDLKSLFWNSEYEIRLGSLSTMVGNSDLKPERTVSWELGAQQQIADNMAIYATLYFKNITNLLGQEIVRLKGGQAYARYINRDYGNVRGIIVSLEKRPVRYLSLNIDYTYQIAKGNASDPFAVFTDNQGTPPRESEKQVMPLNWDQRHTINTTMTFAKSKKWGISWIMQAGSGLPYTPTDPNRSLRIAFENSERKPITFNVDMMAHYNFQAYGINSSLFIKVYNLFDIKNELDVFTDTGRANFTHALNYGLGDRRPDYYSPPRLVLSGIKFKMGR